MRKFQICSTRLPIIPVLIAITLFDSSAIDRSVRTPNNQIGNGDSPCEENLSGFPATHDAPDLPFQISVPYSPNLEWIAGGGGSFYGASFHTGSDCYAIDFNAIDGSDKNSLILSVADGKVERARCGYEGFGCMVVISHFADDSHCYASRYAHLLEGSFLVDENKNYPRGTPIGRVGSTGLKPDNEHLHFALYKVENELCGTSPEIKLEDENLAVLPLPMGTFTNIGDGDLVASKNFPVGFGPWENSQIADPDDNIFLYHPVIVDHYKKYGGQFGLRVYPVSYVERLEALDAYVQRFGPVIDPVLVDPSFAWWGLGRVILEVGDKPFMLIEPIWIFYLDQPNYWSTIGPPTSDTYFWIVENRLSFRSDFRNASILFFPEEGLYEVIDIHTGRWQGFFWNRPDDQSGIAHQRRDRLLDFRWEDANNPGPFFAPEGFSARWMLENLDPLPSLEVSLQVQGHLDLLIDDQLVLTVDSPNQVAFDSTSGFSFGNEQIQINFWQEGGKPALLKVSTSSSLVLPVFADEDGAGIASSGLVPMTVAFPDIPIPVLAPDGSTAPEGTTDFEVLDSFVGKIYDDASSRFSRSGTGWQTLPAGYAGQFHFVQNSQSGSDVSGTWLLNPTAQGYWSVLVFVPKEATTRNATYKLQLHETQHEIQVDQYQNRGKWVRLGTFDFAAQGDEYLTLHAETGEATGSAIVAYDAVGLEFVSRESGGDSTANPLLCLNSAILIFLAALGWPTRSRQRFRLKRSKTPN